MAPPAWAVVTGSSSGIGRAAALRLAALGFTVFAGVRRQEDADAATREGLRAVHLDVTDDVAVQQAVEAVGLAGGGRLDVLVNNAGIAVAGPLESLDAGALSRVLDVNVLGAHRVTRAFLPLVAAARGRIINVSSISGRIGYPYLGAYALSKHALEGYSDALRRELSPHGVRVVVIQPGAIDTPMWSKSALPPAALDCLPEGYRAEARRLLGALERRGRAGVSSERVAAIIARAATALQPRARYALPLPTRIQARLVPLLPDAIIDWAVDRRLGRR